MDVELDRVDSPVRLQPHILCVCVCVRMCAKDKSASGGTGHYDVVFNFILYFTFDTVGRWKSKGENANKFTILWKFCFLCMIRVQTHTRQSRDRIR